ncbi:MAG: phosphate ABC transporter permease PstA [Chloroflexi bacterium]|nr:phosphate ABC transporter permease PstA [Chloroflexota bacterium]
MTTIAAPAPTVWNPRLTLRRWIGRIFVGACLLAVLVGLTMLGALVVDVLLDGASRLFGLPTILDTDFLNSFASRFPDRAGVKAAVIGTLYMMAITAAVAFPLGVAAAIYLEEYARRNWFSRLVQLNIANLAGIPSIVYGLLGLQLFVRAMELERSVLSGSLTMALLVMPIIIVAGQESLRAVPPSMREGAYALGATRWQVTRSVVLPYAFGGMLTGNILAMSRAIGETAPLIMIGALTFIAFLPQDPLDPFTVLPIQIFNWVSRPQPGFQEIAAAGIILLLIILLIMNSLAIFLRAKTRVRW